jgi:hypothetical protein
MGLKKSTFAILEKNMSTNPKTWENRNKIQHSIISCEVATVINSS